MTALGMANGRIASSVPHGPSPDSRLRPRQHHRYDGDVHQEQRQQSVAIEAPIQANSGAHSQTLTASM